MTDTIAAISTPPGRGGVGIIRISGPDAPGIASAVFSGSVDNLSPRRLTRGQVRDRSGRYIDDVLCALFPAPHSYTGEMMVEFHCHGSPAILREVIAALFQAGARSAAAGEFTRRAFLNGRLDLSQVEAVGDLILAETPDAAASALGQLDGAISRRIAGIADGLTDLLAHFAAVIDYPDDDIPVLPPDEILSALRGHQTALSALAESYERGRFLRDGVPAVLLGRPNVGKSSVLNALLGYERAIVTDIPGTTRDTLEESVHLGGQYLRLRDTAGLREGGEAIEREGIRRTREAVRAAALVLLVLDGSLPLTAEDQEAMDLVRGKAAVVLVNKSDKGLVVDLGQLEAAFQNVCPFSALTGEGITLLDGKIRHLFAGDAPPCDGSILTNARQAEAVSRAAAACGEAVAALESGVTPDAVLCELESALEALRELTGRSIREDVLTRVFERFCVGK